MTLFSLHKNPRLLVILATALVQGFVLRWLHEALSNELWPTGSAQWLVTFYALAVFVPLTIQIMSEHWRHTRLWAVAAAMAGLLVYFGWHFGVDASFDGSGKHQGPPEAAIFFATLAVLWVHFVPFLRVRLQTGRWRCAYDDLFTAAWHQALMLAEAALFTGLFWALLALWAALFKMLGYGFFRWLFLEPAFAYPFTAVAFGIALYLTDSLDKLVTVVREQLLGVLKWLAPVAALILVLFAPTLLFKLPDLVFQSERAISAAWLLWLIAFTVLLLNAGYQNGRIEQPYPRALGIFLRIAIPAMLVVAGTALYALFIRVMEYGLTAPRFFALIVALVALVYSIGYTLAALRKGIWLRGIERVNVAVAVGLMIVLALTLTPIASPYRLSADSQLVQALTAQDERRESALLYLRFDSGNYGLRALERLMKFRGATQHAEDIRQQAAAMLKRQSREEGNREVDAQAALADLSVYPADRKMPPELLQALKKDLNPQSLQKWSNDSEPKPLALFVDLNADGVEECVVFVYSRYLLYTLHGQQWAALNAKNPPYFAIGRQELRKALAAGEVTALPQTWRDLRIGKRVLQFESPIGGRD